MIGNCTSLLDMQQTLPCLKRIRTTFLMYKNNPKNAWKTINEILGRRRKQNTVNEIKLPEKTITSTEEIVDVLTIIL